MIGIASQGLHPALDLLEVGGRVFRPGLDGEDAVGVARREINSLGRGAGLQDGGSVLRRTDNIERTPGCEEASVVLDATHPGRVGEDRILPIHDHGIGVPAVPEFPAHLHVLVRLVVAQFGGLAFGPVIGLLVPVDRGDDVPRGASAGQVVDGRPEARGVERMLVAGRKGGGDADAAGDRGDPGQQGDRVVFRRLGGIAQGRGERAGIGIGNVVEVGEEHHVEQAAFTDPGDVLVELRARPVVVGEFGLRMPPHSETVVARSMDQELGEMDLPRSHVSSIGEAHSTLKRCTGAPRFDPRAAPERPEDRNDHATMPGRSSVPPGRRGRSARLARRSTLQSDRSEFDPLARDRDADGHAVFGRLRSMVWNRHGSLRSEYCFSHRRRATGPCAARAIQAATSTICVRSGIQ